MKFVITSRVNNLNGCTLPLSVSSTQEIHLSNSRATIKTLRAVIAIKFKLPPMSFSMVYMGPKTDVQWNDESNVIEASGLEDGDRMWVLPKDVSLSDVLKNDTAEEQNKIQNTTSHIKSTSETTTVATTNNETVQKLECVDRTSPPLKVFRAEFSAVTDEETGQGAQSNTSINEQSNLINNDTSAAAETLAKAETKTENANTQNNQIIEDNNSHSNNNTNANENPKEEISTDIIDNMKDDNEDEDDVDVGKDNEDEEEEEEMEENGPDELYERLMEVTPNLMEMREEFLAHPEEVMQRIHTEDPKLFSLITANQESFVELVNNADFVRALQDEKEAYEFDWISDEGVEDGDFDDDDDEDGINAEMNEAAVEAMHSLYLQLLAGDSARARQHAGASSEEANMGNNEESNSHIGNNNEGTTTNSDNKEHNDSNVNGNEQDTSEGIHNNNTLIAGQAKITRNSVPLQHAQISDILAYAPSEEDMRKIEGLTELGFTFDQCKVAFYSCRRSLERAANFLFESPPKL